MPNDFSSNFAGLAASVDILHRRYEENDQIERKPVVDTANAAMATAEELRALHEAIQHEGQKRDKADKRNLALSISGLVLMAATLVAALVSLFGK